MLNFIRETQISRTKCIEICKLYKPRYRNVLGQMSNTPLLAAKLDRKPFWIPRLLAAGKFIALKLHYPYTKKAPTGFIQLGLSS